MNYAMGRDPARVLPSKEGRPLTFLKRERTARVCACCGRETRGWYVVDGVVMCRGCDPPNG